MSLFPFLILPSSSFHLPFVNLKPEKLEVDPLTKEVSMKNRTPMIDQRGQTQNLDWLYEEGGEDFLQGKAPIAIQDVWEDEE